MNLFILMETILATDYEEQDEFVFHGIFDSEDEARSRCQNVYWFYYKANLNEFIDDDAKAYCNPTLESMNN